MSRPLSDSSVLPGDLLVALVPGGHYQIARMSANGHSEYVLGYQRDRQAALRTADRATSGDQRVFVRADGATGEYRPIDASESFLR
jgi:hypothetical protein